MRVILSCIGSELSRASGPGSSSRETLRATAEHKGVDALRDERLRARIVERFTGPDYGWMWPFRRQVESWYDAARDEIEAALRPEAQNSGT
jgi:hypothetical protein